MFNCCGLTYLVPSLFIVNYSCNLMTMMDQKHSNAEIFLQGTDSVSFDTPLLTLITTISCISFTKPGLFFFFFPNMCSTFMPSHFLSPHPGNCQIHFSQRMCSPINLRPYQRSNSHIWPFFLCLYCIYMTRF